jgi:hypothetical protein
MVCRNVLIGTRDVSFINPAAPIRGSAEVVYRDSPTFSRYNEVTYTACEPGNQDWMLHASRMKVNDETGRASVKNAWLEFKSVPVMYFPIARRYGQIIIRRHIPVKRQSDIKTTTPGQTYARR